MGKFEFCGSKNKPPTQCYIFVYSGILVNKKIIQTRQVLVALYTRFSNLPIFMGIQVSRNKYL